MKVGTDDEWRVIERLLPAGWQEAARERGAFQRARYTTDPASLLRLLLFHAVNDGGLRETVAQARASGIAQMSPVALYKRLRSSGAWLAWLGAELARALREQPRLPQELRPRAIDSTTVQGPASKGTQWRVHYSLELVDLNCEWLALTDAHGAELLERTPRRRGDVLLAERNYLRPVGVHAATAAGAYVLLRLRWSHAPMVDCCQRPLHAWQPAKKLRVGQVRVWPVMLPVPAGMAVSGRVVAMRLPAPRAAKAHRRVTQCARRKGRQLDPRTLQAAQLVMLFTTLPATLLDASGVLELYRYRWQLELACKRLKQLLKLGHLPHQRPDIARTWILAKLVVALLLETLYRNARVFSPWGYRLDALTAAWP